MNKLVIIGNGFDLAHGLETRYSDFLLWEINEAFKQTNIVKPSSFHIESPLFAIESNYRICQHPSLDPCEFEDIAGFLQYLKDNKDGRLIIKIKYSYSFVEHLIQFANRNWVDIEREYYIKLLFVYQLRSSKNNTWRKILTELNSALELLRSELVKYLKCIKYNGCLQEIMDCFNYEIGINRLNLFDKVLFLNFNYTSTVENYLQSIDNDFVKVNYVHGKLEDENNPIIFGYGDETDKNYETIEDLNENEFTRHFKSFSYLTTSNYQDLFEYLGKDKFEVHIMGHSCGLSDRVLFNHIFEHDNFDRVQLYYYQYGEKDYENDYFQKTQELSRYFKLNSKHKMRTKVVPFSKSKPLTTYKP